MNIFKFLEKMDCNPKLVNDNVMFLTLATRVCEMLDWKNLDDTISLPLLKMGFYLNGSVCVFEENGKLRNMTGGLSGELDFYGFGTEYIGTTFKEAYQRSVDDSVVGWLFDSHISLLPIILYYSEKLSNTDTALDVALDNSKLTAIIPASSDKEKQAIEYAIDKVRSGTPSVYLNEDYIKKLIDSGQHDMAIDLTGCKGDHTYIPMILQAYDHLLARVCREIGINITDVMKRAQVINAEINGYENYTQIMLACIEKNAKDFVDRVNKKYDRNWEVSLNLAFKDDNPDEEVESNEN